jgi:hypothetical protein
MEQQPLKRVEGESDLAPTAPKRVLMSPRGVKKANPRKMLAEFSSMTTLKWVGVALAIHVLVITASSLGTIRDWCDPEGAKVRAAAAVRVAEDAAKPPAPTATPGAAAGASRSGTKPADEKAGDDRKGSPVMKRLSETATAPKESGRSGIDLDDVLGK